MNRKQNSLMRFSRTERLAQLSEQEIVIERKKREIQAKLEAQKKKQTEEVFKKLESSKETKTNKPGLSKKSSESGSEYEKNSTTEKPVEKVKESLTNAFSNDGSFLDQFKKLSQTGIPPNYASMQSLAKKTEGNLKTQDASEEVAADSGREPLDSRIQLQIPPPGVVHLVAQKQNISGVSSTDNQKSQSNFLPQFQSGAQTSPLACNSDSTQLYSSQANFSGTVQGVQPLQCPVFNTKSPDDISINSQRSPASLTVQNSPSELPKVRSESILLTLKSNPVKKLEAIPNPLEVDRTPSPTAQTENQFNFKEKNLNFSTTSILEHIASHNMESSQVSSAFYKDGEDKEESDEQLDNNFHHWAELVARFGDEFEESLRIRKENDPNLRFLMDKSSKEYLSYRKLVYEYRKRLESSGQGHSNVLQVSGGSDYSVKSLSSSEQISTTDTETHSKNYNGQPDNEGRFMHNESSQAISKEHAPLFQQQSEATGENSDGVKNSEEIKTEERRKRKRKSRWGDAVPTTSNPGNLNLQPPGTLPAPKSALLSQLTRSDPGLIQYARQTFGSTDLSEEDWRKAEDHYKINLLYQDMVKKRAEVEKLERQGKFKYEYDSDEDTEGGTWEHKLRKQEMQATQLWAEELTRQAAGKHHIGDFLPPEELERFMEKYNAVKEGREPDLSDYKEYKLKQDNVGYRLLQKMGWNEGKGLGQDGTGITNPVNKATTRHENQGLGVERPDGLAPGDDEYDAYRKRMMLAYRFRPNPLNNPRRPYY